VAGFRRTLERLKQPRPVAVVHPEVVFQENPNYNGGKVTTSCSICGDSFEYYPSEKEGLYCPSCVESEQWQSPPALTGSDNPQWNGGKQTMDCDTCGATVERWRTGSNGRTFCDTDCQSEWLSKNFVGTDHPN